MSIKTDNKVFGDTGIEIHNCYYQKSSISIYEADIDKTLISNKIFFAKNGFKYFVG